MPEDVLLKKFATTRDSIPFVALTVPAQDPIGRGFVILFLLYARVDVLLHPLSVDEEQFFFCLSI